VAPPVDGHAHVGRWRTPDFSGRETTLAQAERLYRALGYAGALVMPTDEGDNEGLAREVAASGFPFRLCAWVDPEDRTWDRFAEARGGLVEALKVHPSFLRRRVTDGALTPFYRWAADRGAPVLVHCGRWQEMASYRLALDAAERHPDVRWILCHMGGDSTELVTAAVDALLERRLDNVWLGTESIRQYWIVQRALDRLGPGRLVFGSDYNLNHPRSFQAVVEALDASEADRAAILGGNLAGLLPGREMTPRDARSDATGRPITADGDGERP